MPSICCVKASHVERLACPNEPKRSPLSQICEFDCQYSNSVTYMQKCSLDMTLFDFLEQYMKRLEGPLALQVWNRFLQLAKDLLGSMREFRPQAFAALRWVLKMKLEYHLIAVVQMLHCPCRQGFSDNGSGRPANSEGYAGKVMSSIMQSDP